MSVDERLSFSGNSYVGSSENQKSKLFDSSEYNDIENDRGRSLQLLSNSIYVATCTILHQRRLIPEKSFIDFTVYGDVKGYIMDQKDRYGETVAKKFGQATDAIMDRILKKFAVVVEDEINNCTVEAFIWHFKYDIPGEAVAELGINGKKSTFTIKYSDMYATCKQFCILFSDLRKILSELSPFSNDVTPSFRLAYFGEPDSFPGYFQIDRFVDINQISVGKVRYPHEEVSLTYASNYARYQEKIVYDNATEQDVENVSMDTDLNGGFEETRNMQDGVEEGVQDTMLLTELDNSSNDDELFEEELSHQSDNGISELCQPNLISQQEMNNNSAETIIMSRESNIYSQLTASPEPSLASLEKSVNQETVSPKRAVSFAKSSQDESKSKKMTGEKRKRLEQEKMQILKKSSQTSKNIESVGSMKSHDSKMSRTYGRVPSIRGLIENERNMDAKRYGISKNIRSNEDLP